MQSCSKQNSVLLRKGSPRIDTEGFAVVHPWNQWVNDLPALPRDWEVQNVLEAGGQGKDLTSSPLSQVMDGRKSPT